jgi:hypothetical protein
VRAGVEALLAGTAAVLAAALLAPRSVPPAGAIIGGTMAGNRSTCRDDSRPDHGLARPIRAGP